MVETAPGRRSLGTSAAAGVTTATAMPSRSFWQGRRVFVTGHTGFKGSWLSLWLDALGAKVKGYALEPPTEPNLFERANVAAGLEHVLADVRDYPRLERELAAHRADVVIHMAAQSVVKAGYEDPVGTYSSNVMGTVHVLEAVRKSGRPCVIVNVTSDKCYANVEWVWGYRENEPMGGKDPYSNSKGCAELVTTAYRESFFPVDHIGKHGIALASARAGNAIGGGDWTKNQLIPDLMRAFLAGESCQIRSPSSIRPWQFVLEPLRGYLVLAERLSQDPIAHASGWNFGPVDTDAKPVSWIADELVRCWGESAAWAHDGAVHQKEAHFLKLDISKAGVHLNWRPLLALPGALEWIVEWYRGFREGADLRKLTLAQIERYEARARDPESSR
jgi:CDP-glucose 4,6-dehydratase